MARKSRKVRKSRKSKVRKVHKFGLPSPTSVLSDAEKDKRKQRNMDLANENRTLNGIIRQEKEMSVINSNKIGLLEAIIKLNNDEMTNIVTSISI